MKWPVKTEDKMVKFEESMQVPEEPGFSRGNECPSYDLTKLLTMDILPDVYLKCGNVHYPVHKCILGFHSEVLRTRFSNEMLANPPPTIEISNLDAGVLKKFIDFFYLGKPELSPDSVAPLYEAACKYNVPCLQLACKNWIITHLDTRTCVKYLEIAYIHSDDELKAKLISFLVRNEDLLRGDEWYVLSKSAPWLGIEVYKAFMASIKI